MGEWSRREVLRALGGAAAAPTLAPLALGCGAGALVPGADEPASARPPGEVRAHLRRIVERLARRYTTVHALLCLERRARVVVDSAETVTDVRHRGEVVLAASDGASWFEVATGDLGAAGLDAAVRSLRARAPAGGPIGATTRPGALAPPRALPTAGNTDGHPRDWIDLATELHERARGAGDSRIVYRAAHIDVTDAERVFLGAGRDVSERRVRALAGATLVAWAGDTTVAEAATGAGLAPVDPWIPSEAAIAGAAERALALLTARPSPEAEEGPLVLDPEAAAAFVRRCVAPALAADVWAAGGARAAELRGRRIGSGHVTLVDDPAASGYGGYRFDDDGTAPRRTELVSAGVLETPFADARSARALGIHPTGNGRRPAPTAAVASTPSNLVLHGSARPVAHLYDAEPRGLVLEGALDARVDPITWRFALRAARAREFAGGALTGRLFGPMDLVGDVTDILRAVRGVAGAPRPRPAGENGAPETVWTPHVLTRGRALGR